MKAAILIHPSWASLVKKDYSYEHYFDILDGNNKELGKIDKGFVFLPRYSKNTIISLFGLFKCKLDEIISEYKDDLASVLLDNISIKFLNENLYFSDLVNYNLFLKILKNKFGKLNVCGNDTRLFLISLLKILEEDYDNFRNNLFFLNGHIDYNDKAFFIMNEFVERYKSNPNIKVIEGGSIAFVNILSSHIYETERIRQYKEIYLFGEYLNQCVQLHSNYLYSQKVRHTILSKYSILNAEDTSDYSCNDVFSVVNY